jgi:hypothetical protein
MTPAPEKVVGNVHDRAEARAARKGADLLLQVRCAVYNGTLGAGLGIDLTGSPMQT